MTATHKKVLNPVPVFFNRWPAKPKPITPCIFDFPQAMLQILAGNSDCFIVLFAPVVIGENDYFGIGSLTVSRRPPYHS